MRRDRSKYLLLAAGILLVGIMPLTSEALTITLNSLGYGQNISYTYNGLTGSWAGQFYVSGNGGNYLAFCVDLDDWISPGNPYTATALPVTANYFGAAWLVSQFGSSVSSNAEAAALQAAIWETIYGSQFTLDPNSPVYSQFNTYLSQLPTNLSDLGSYSLLDLEGSQMLVAMVPEPSTLFLLGTGLVGLGIVMRFRKGTT